MIGNLGGLRFGLSQHGSVKNLEFFSERFMVKEIKKIKRQEFRIGGRVPSNHLLKEHIHQNAPSVAADPAMPRPETAGAMKVLIRLMNFSTPALPAGA